LHRKQSKSPLSHVVSAPAVTEIYNAHLTCSNQNILIEETICRS